MKTQKPLSTFCKPLFFLISFFFCSLNTHLEGIEKPVEFVIVTPSYNNERWAVANLESVFKQSYPYWSLIYIDDCSSDQTFNIVTQCVKDHNLQEKCQIIHNSKRCGALANLYTAITSVDPHKVIVTLDGDDTLAHSRVLSILAKVYSDKRIWLTYGNYRNSDTNNAKSCCKAFPEKIIKACAFRSYKWVSSHLRTFYAGLFQKIKREDLLWNNQFYPMAWDLAMMFPMLEMAAGGHFKFISSILYIYNVGNPINDNKVDLSLLLKLGEDIRAKTPYKKIRTLFNIPPATTNKKKAKGSFPFPFDHSNDAIHPDLRTQGTKLVLESHFPSSKPCSPNKRTL